MSMQTDYDNLKALDGKALKRLLPADSKGNRTVKASKPIVKPYWTGADVRSYVALFDAENHFRPVEYEFVSGVQFPYPAESESIGVQRPYPENSGVQIPYPA